MRKVIIADDEKVILKGLSKIIPWEEVDLEVADTANDGNELYEKILNVKPDIVVTDVRMPDISGIEVMKKVREDGDLNVKFIFISGYQEFVYVKEALAEGAVDYLIKPVSAKELENSLKKAINDIEKVAVYDIFNSYDKDDIESVLDNIDYDSEFDKERLVETFKEANISLDNKFFVGLTMGIVPETEKRLKSQSISMYQLKKFAIFSKFFEFLKKKGQAFVVKNEENYMSLICVFEKSDKKVYFEKYIHPIRFEVEEEYGIDIRMGFGDPVDSVEKLKETFNRSKEVYDYYFFEEKRVLVSDSFKKKREISFEAEYEEGVEKIIKSIVKKDGGFLKNVDMLLMLVRKIHYGNEFGVKSRIMLFTGDILFRLMNYKLIKEDFYMLQDSLQKDLEEQSTFREVHMATMKFYEKLAADINFSEHSKDKAAIERVKAYIKENYREDISLKQLAKMAYVSESYFSSMFKNATGKNYKTYLTDIRIEEAVNLIMTTDMKMYEIGFEVGYNNTRRFFESFKERYGVAPSMYKKMIQKEKKGKC